VPTPAEGIPEFLRRQPAAESESPIITADLLERKLQAKFEAEDHRAVAPHLPITATDNPTSEPEAAETIEDILKREFRLIVQRALIRGRDREIVGAAKRIAKALGDQNLESYDFEFRRCEQRNTQAANGSAAEASS
jgi:hypothetical protein